MKATRADEVGAAAESVKGVAHLPPGALGNAGAGHGYAGAAAAAEPCSAFQAAVAGSSRSSTASKRRPLPWMDGRELKPARPKRATVKKRDTNPMLIVEISDDSQEMPGCSSSSRRPKKEQKRPHANATNAT